MQRNRVHVIILAMMFSLSACSKSSNPPAGPPAPPVPVTPLISLPPGWKIAQSYMSAFPEGIQLYAFDSIYAGQKVKAFCLAYDSRNTLFDFKPVFSSTAKTPTQFFSEEPGTSYACINGGFFGGGQSYSLVMHNNLVTSSNIRSVTRTFNGVNTTYYPTRAAFGFVSGGKPEVSWIYHIGSSTGMIFSYPSPSPNSVNAAPQPIPIETFPAGGAPWTASTAIGGSPVLIKEGNVRITDQEELISINNTSPRPRSAVGYLQNGIVLLLAVEGDNPADYPGVDLEDLASMLKGLGCYEAMNLDGGGSTSMIVNSIRTVRPGDNGVERPVQSAILIKRR